MTIMVPKDTKGNALYSESSQGMDPKYPQHGLSNDHLMAKRDQIVDVHHHPANNLPEPVGTKGSGMKAHPMVKGAKKTIDDSSHFGKGNKAKQSPLPKLGVGS